MFYSGAERHYVIEAVLDSATRGGTVIITAPKGGGVSAVLGRAAMRLVDYATVVRIDALQVHSKHELMTSLLSYFDVPKNDFLSALTDALAQGPLVVLVDNGEALSADLIELLAKFQQHFAGAFAVVVGGELALKQQLKAAQAWADASYLSLAALSPAEASEFLLKIRSLKVAEAELAKISQEFWPQDLMEYSQPISKKILPWKHIIVVLALLLLLLIVWAMKADPADEKIKLNVQAPAKPQIATEGTDSTIVKEEIVLTPTIQTGAPRKPSAIEERVAKDIVFDPDAVNTEPEDKTPSTALGNKVDNVKPVVQVSGPKLSKPVEQQEAQQGLREHQWLARQNPEHWAMQVTLASSEAQAQQLCEQIGSKNTAYYRAIRNNRSVYIVLLASFETREQARNAAAQLPAELLEKGPFLRQLAQIQGELP